MLVVGITENSELLTSFLHIQTTFQCTAWSDTEYDCCHYLPYSCEVTLHQRIDFSIIEKFCGGDLFKVLFTIVRGKTGHKMKLLQEDSATVNKFSVVYMSRVYNSKSVQSHMISTNQYGSCTLL